MTKLKKSCLLQLKSITEKGEVTFYFAGWDKDRDGDTIDQHAYDKTLVENKDFIYHNIDHENVVGMPIDFGVDEKGAWCTSKLSLNTEDGLDAYNKYKDGLIKGHSQEFVVKKSTGPIGNRKILEMELWGVTSVTKIPANADTPTLAIKSFMDAEDHMRKINALITAETIGQKSGRAFLLEYKKLEELVTKNNAMALAGIVHCDNCKVILPEYKSNEGESSTEEEQMQCPGCGRFVNAKTGKQSKSHTMKTDKKNFLSSKALEEFGLETKGRKEDSKVIGTTWSDKSIHADPGHEGHEDFTQGEHEQAAAKHLELAKAEAKSAMDADSDKDKKNHLESAEAHVDAHAEHMKMSFKCMK